MAGRFSFQLANFSPPSAMPSLTSFRPGLTPPPASMTAPPQATSRFTMAPTSTPAPAPTSRFTMAPREPGLSSFTPTTSRPLGYSEHDTPKDYGMSPELRKNIGLVRTGLGGVGTLAKLGGEGAVAGGAKAVTGAIGLGADAYDLAKGGDSGRFLLRGAGDVNAISQGAAQAAQALGYAGPALDAISSYAPYVGAALNVGSNIYAASEGQMEPGQAAIYSGLDVATGVASAVNPVLGAGASLLSEMAKRNLGNEYFKPGLPHEVRDRLEAQRGIVGGREDITNLRYAGTPDEAMHAIQGMWTPGSDNMVAVSVHDKDGKLLGYLNGDHSEWGIPTLGFADAYKAVQAGGAVRGTIEAGVRPERLTEENTRLGQWLTSAIRLHGDAAAGNPGARGIIQDLQAKKQAAVAQAQGAVQSPDYLAALTTEIDPGREASTRLGGTYGTGAQAALEAAVNADPRYDARRRELYLTEATGTDTGHPYDTLSLDELRRIANQYRQERVARQADTLSAYRDAP